MTEVRAGEGPVATPRPRLSLHDSIPPKRNYVMTSSRDPGPVESRNNEIFYTLLEAVDSRGNSPWVCIEDDYASIVTEGALSPVDRENFRSKQESLRSRYLSAMKSRADTVRRKGEGNYVVRSSIRTTPIPLKDHDSGKVELRAHLYLRLQG